MRETGRSHGRSSRLHHTCPSPTKGAEPPKLDGRSAAMRARAWGTSGLAPAERRPGTWSLRCGCWSHVRRSPVLEGMIRWPRCSDADLLAATATQPAAFAEFYLRYERPVLVYLRRRARDPEVVADLLAEVFASALAGAGRFDPARAGGDGAFGWLFAIARNTLLSSIARGRVADEARRALSMLEPLVLTDERLERIDETVAHAGIDIDELLRALPGDQRQAVTARVLDERGYDEIAAELECSSLVVRKRVSRGLAALRIRLTALHSAAQENR